MTTDLQFGALLTVLGRIADALERQNAAAAEAAADDTLTFTISDYKTFDWSSIGATVVQRDADGVSLIRAANGKLAKRRSNDKFGTEIWFSYAIGEKADGTPQYQRVIEFREILPPEPLGRKTEQALSKAPAATAVTPAPAPKADPVAEVARKLGGQVREEGGQLAVPVAPPAKPASRNKHVDDQHAEAAKAYRERFNVADIPGHLVLAWDDTLAAVEQKIAALTRMATTGDQWGAHDVPADRTVPAPPPSANESIEITPDEQARTEITSQVKRIGMRKATPAQHAEVTAALKAHGLEFAEFCWIVWQRPVADVSEGWVLGLHGWLRPSRDGQGRPFAANPAAREIVKAMAKAVPA
jgi:hypothetical protein